jgi:tRNA modification GTPase
MTVKCQELTPIALVLPMNVSKKTPTVVRLTAPGRGALATLLVRGPGAVELVDRLFRANRGQPLRACPTCVVVVGRFGDAHHAAEEIVAHRTSDKEVLLHCHGGTASVDRIESLLVEQGATVVGWREWVAVAHDDPLQAKALIALAEATTERTAGILLDQYHGALRRAIDKIIAAMEDGDTEGARRSLDRLLAQSNLGLHLTRPWKVVLAGPPNAGKSSLLNALVGYARAIVHATPGTTRDLVTALTAIDGWPVELVDTAGLRDGDHPVEVEGVSRAREEMAAADLVLLVLDATEGALDEDLSLGGPRAKTIVVRNKLDLVADATGWPGSLATSAVRGDGIPELLRGIAEGLVPDPPSPGQAIPWTERQIGRLQAARAAIGEGDMAKARQELGGA